MKKNLVEWFLSGLACLILSFHLGCSELAPEPEPPTQNEIDMIEFAGNFAKLTCEQFQKCDCNIDWTVPTCEKRVTTSVINTLSKSNNDVTTFNKAHSDSLLNIISQFDCKKNLVSYERFGLMYGMCSSYVSLFEGSAQLGEACTDTTLYLYPLSNCSSGLVCDISGTCVEPCNARFTDLLIEGEKCESGFLVTGECAPGLGCASSDGDDCRRLAGEGGTCLYNMCAPGHTCEVIISTRTCRENNPPPPNAVCDYLSEVHTEPWNCSSDAECDDANACTIDKCSSGVCVTTAMAAGTVCDDGLYCNGPDLCNDVGRCTQHAGDPCDEGAACNTTCNENEDTCFDPVNSSCDDGTYCTVNKSCDAVGNCIGGEPRDCNDNNDCSFDICSEEQKRCNHPEGVESVGLAGSCTDGIDNDCDNLPDAQDPFCQVCTPANTSESSHYMNDYKHLAPGQLVYHRYTYGFPVSGPTCPQAIHISGDGNPQFEYFGYDNWATDGFMPEEGGYIRLRALASEQPGGVHKIDFTVGERTRTWTLTTCAGPDCMEGEFGRSNFCSWDENPGIDMVAAAWTCAGSDSLIYAEDITRNGGNGETAFDQCPAGATSCVMEPCSVFGHRNATEIGSLACPGFLVDSLLQ